MRVLVLGASGFIGEAVLRQLGLRDHEVVGLVRTRESAQRLAGSDHQVIQGDVGDVAAIARTAGDFDAVIYAAAPDDQPTVENKLAQQLTEALAGTERKLLWTSGVRVAQAPSGGIGDEDSELVFDGPVGWKARSEATVVAARSVRAVAIRPPFVYAPAGTGIVALLRSLRRDGPAVPYPGDGSAQWSTVHVEDLADLYVRALESDVAARVYVGAAASTITLRELATLISELDGLDGRTEACPVDVLRGMIGPMADLLASDAVFSGARAERDLGWRPSGPDIRAVLAPGAPRPAA